MAAFDIDQAMARDAQLWESLLDAHFARGSWHVGFYLKSTEINKFKSLATPESLTTALSWKSGI